MRKPYQFCGFATLEETPDPFLEEGIATLEEIAAAITYYNAHRGIRARVTRPRGPSPFYLNGLHLIPVEVPNPCVHMVAGTFAAVRQDPRAVVVDLPNGAKLEIMIGPRLEYFVFFTERPAFNDGCKEQDRFGRRDLAVLFSVIRSNIEESTDPENGYSLQEAGIAWLKHRATLYAINAAPVLLRWIRKRIVGILERAIVRLGSRPFDPLFDYWEDPIDLIPPQDLLP